MDKDGFIVVQRKKGRAKSSSAFQNCFAGLAIKSDKDDQLFPPAFFQQILRKIQFYKNHIITTQRWKKLTKEKHAIMMLIAYGLGTWTNILTPVTARIQSLHQLAWFLLMKEYFNPEKIVCYDPILTINDHNLLNLCDIEVIHNNDHIQHPITKPTLFFMPHCPPILFYTLFETNWTTKSLEKLYIVGNNLEGYQESKFGNDDSTNSTSVWNSQTRKKRNRNKKHTKQDISSPSMCFGTILKCIHSKKLEDDGHDSDILNDSFHEIVLMHYNQSKVLPPFVESHLFSTFSKRTIQ